MFYEKALKDGSVHVYRGRVLLVGQDRAGKTSLKKSLLGLPFNPKEESTEGIEVDPSVCEIEVHQVKNWNSTGKNKPSLAEFSENISRMLAEKHYQCIANEVKEESAMESYLELTGEEATMEVGTNSSEINQVCTLQGIVAGTKQYFRATQFQKWSNSVPLIGRRSSWVALSRSYTKWFSSSIDPLGQDNVKSLLERFSTKKRFNEAEEITSRARIFVLSRVTKLQLNFVYFSMDPQSVPGRLLQNVWVCCFG